MRSVRKRLTYANVMSSIAVFFVLAGGTAFATAEMLPKNSVGSKQIKKEAVGLAKISAAARSSLQGAAGPVGPSGPAGIKGDKGEEGARGPSAGFSVNTGSQLEFTAGPQTVATLNLPAGKYIVTGYTTANNNSSAQASVNCNVVLGGTQIGMASDVNLAANVGLDRQILTVSAGGSLAGPGRAELVCTVTPSPPNGNYLGRGLTAVEVGSLNGA